MIKLKRDLFKIIKDNYNLFYVFFRYILLLVIIIFGYNLIYIILKPLTIKITSSILDIFYNVYTNNELIIINFSTYIYIADACISASGYLLLIILNLTIPLKIETRIKSILYLFGLFFIINIGRIVFFSLLYHNKFKYTDITHVFFWYILSIFFVLLIWFVTIKKFKIKDIPIYTDLLYIKNISSSKNKLRKL